MKNLPSCAHILHKTLNLAISHCCFAEGDKEINHMQDIVLLKKVIPAK